MNDLEIFAANGFHFDVDEAAEPSRRLRLTALPFSKNTQFGEEGTPRRLLCQAACRQ
jgi:hypothetical protein